MADSLFSILFPSRCLGCGTSSVPLCERCIALTRKSLIVPHPYITSAFDFKDPLIKKSIHAIKYYRRRDLVVPLTEKLAECLQSTPQINSYTLVPIPMPLIRKLLRGYNQAELIANTLGARLKLPVRKDILVRRKSPGRQAISSTKQERLQKQRGSFLVRDHSIKRILLIDDVTTTGATLEEARKELLRNGAETVLAGTLAH